MAGPTVAGHSDVVHVPATQYASPARYAIWSGLACNLPVFVNLVCQISTALPAPAVPYKKHRWRYFVRPFPFLVCSLDFSPVVHLFVVFLICFNVARDIPVFNSVHSFLNFLMHYLLPGILESN